MMENIRCGFTILTSQAALLPFETVKTINERAFSELFTNRFGTVFLRRESVLIAV
jgi:hypothetical protein